MLRKISSNSIYSGEYGWHTGRFHFSFAEYMDANNPYFGDLLTFNDFELTPGSGFDLHPHQEIDIISYCVNGRLQHEDNLGNKSTLQRGDVQYTCAGSGILHAERNASIRSPLRFIQIWIRPRTQNLPPQYSVHHLDRHDRLNVLFQITSAQEGEALVRVNQDINIFTSELEAGMRIRMENHPDRQVYLSNLEGSLNINNNIVEAGDSVKIRDRMELTLIANESCHFLMVEMAAQ